MTLRAPGGGTMKVDGSAGPLSAAGIGATPLDASVTVKRLDLASTGVVEPSAGISGVVDVHRGPADRLKFEQRGPARNRRCDLEVVDLSRGGVEAELRVAAGVDIAPCRLQRADGRAAASPTRAGRSFRPSGAT